MTHLGRDDIDDGTHKGVRQISLERSRLNDFEGNHSQAERISAERITVRGEDTASVRYNAFCCGRKLFCDPDPAGKRGSSPAVFGGDATGTSSRRHVVRPATRSAGSIA